MKYILLWNCGIGFTIIVQNLRGVSDGSCWRVMDAAGLIADNPSFWLCPEIASA